ncbi:hypothetical protein D3C85_1620630 [compost metagenome]
MLGQVQLQAIAVDAQVQRQIGLEAVLELDAETEKTQVELAGLGFIETAQDGDGLVEADRRWRGVWGQQRGGGVPVLVAQLLRDQFQRSSV